MGVVTVDSQARRGQSGSLDLCPGQARPPRSRAVASTYVPFARNPEGKGKEEQEGAWRQEAGPSAVLLGSERPVEILTEPRATLLPSQTNTQSPSAPAQDSGDGTQGRTKINLADQEGHGVPWDQQKQSQDSLRDSMAPWGEGAVRGTLKADEGKWDSGEQTTDPIPQQAPKAGSRDGNPEKRGALGPGSTSSEAGRGSRRCPGTPPTSRCRCRVQRCE